jgi:hypothetical protein
MIESEPSFTGRVPNTCAIWQPKCTSISAAANSYWRSPLASTGLLRGSKDHYAQPRRTLQIKRFVTSGEWNCGRAKRWQSMGKCAERT